MGSFEKHVDWAGILDKVKQLIHALFKVGTSERRFDSEHCLNSLIDKVSTFFLPEKKNVSGLWIRIRMDLHSFCLLYPDPGGKIFQIKTEKMLGNW